MEFRIERIVLNAAASPILGTQVHLERSAGLAVVTLDGAPTRNALDALSAAALVDACDTIDADKSIGVAVIRGAHGTFCSGASRAALAALPHASPHHAYEGLDDLYRAFARFGQLDVPTIAAITGAAVGAGLNLALAADIRIASIDAVLVSGFAPLGLHPGGGHFHLLARAAGFQAAAAMGVFGARMSGAEAKANGLVWDAVPPNDLDAAVELLTTHLAFDPELARAIKGSLHLTCSSGDAWAAATEVERARQMWSLSRPGATHQTSATQDPT